MINIKVSTISNHSDKVLWTQKLSLSEKKICVQAIQHMISISSILLSIRQLYSTYLTTYTHTHTHPFNGPFSRTTWVSRYQKGKTNLDFTEARDSEWQWHQPGHMQVCTSLQTYNHASTPPLNFLQAGCPSCQQPFLPYNIHMQLFSGPSSEITRVSQYQKKRSHPEESKLKATYILMVQRWQWHPGVVR